MTEPRFNKIISLNQEDYDRVEALKSKGNTIIGIFRKGIETLERILSTENKVKK